MDPHCTPPINLRTAQPPSCNDDEEILDYFPLLPDSIDSQPFPLLGNTANDATGCPVYQMCSIILVTPLGKQYRDPPGTRVRNYKVRYYEHNCLIHTTEHTKYDNSYDVSRQVYSWNKLFLLS
ncbi:unnamed protein product [Lasius platythorax]|uniref:Uncharacterized protein n=1 Tax=Lasius platythorax TaxID=488582 RepID=A0AAV2P7N5_9HYME